MDDLQAVEILLVEDSETDGEITLRALGRKALAAVREEVSKAGCCWAVVNKVPEGK